MQSKPRLLEALAGSLYGGTVKDYDRLTHLQRISALHAKGWTTSLEDLLSISIDAECTDPRDKVYGLLSLMNWQTSGQNTIRADYSRSAWDLAVQLVSHVHLHTLNLLVQSMGLDSNTAELQALIAQRSGSRMKRAESCPIHDFIFPLVTVTRLQHDTHGSLQLAFGVEQHRSFDDADILETLEASECLEALTAVEATVCRLQPIYYGQRLIALACGETVPGDIIAVMLNYDRYQCLILRPHTGSTALDVVGIGYMSRQIYNFDGLRYLQYRPENCPMNAEDLLDNEVRVTNLHIRATAEDIMLLLLCSNSLEGVQPTELSTKLLCLTTRPIESPAGAVRFTQAQNLDE